MLYGTSKSARPRKKNATEVKSSDSTSVDELQAKLDKVRLASWKSVGRAFVETRVLS